MQTCYVTNQEIALDVDNKNDDINVNEAVKVNELKQVFFRPEFCTDIKLLHKANCYHAIVILSRQSEYFYNL